MHVKAFGLMTRHPVKLEQVPPELREGLPVDSRGRVDRPPRERAAAVFREFLDALDAAPRDGQARRDPVPDAAVRRLEAVVARLPRVGARPGRRRPRSCSSRGTAPGSPRTIRAELLRWLEERQMSWVVVDAPKVDAGNVPATLVAATTPLAYVRFHGRNAGTWNARGGGARDPLRLPVRRGRAAGMGAAAARAGAAGGGGVRVLQQQQPDERRRAGACRRAAAAAAARGRARTLGLMRVLAVTHGPRVGPELFADVLAEDGHELIEWEIAAHGSPPLDGYDAVIVFGGDQNVGEEVALPVAARRVRRAAAAGSPTRRRCSASASARRRSRTRSARGRPAPGRPARRLLRDELTAAGAADPVLGVAAADVRGAERERVRVRRPAGRGGARASGRSSRRSASASTRGRVQFHPGGAARPDPRLVRRGRARRSRSRSPS